MSLWAHINRVSLYPVAMVSHQGQSSFEPEHYKDKYK